MGLCTSRTCVTLDPRMLRKGPAAGAAGGGAAPGDHTDPKDGESVDSGTSVLGEGILMVQPVGSKTQGGGAGGGGGGGGGINHTAKGYLELGGKGGGGGDRDGEAQALREGGEDEEEEEGDVEELINILDSEESLRSEFLE